MSTSSIVAGAYARRWQVLFVLFLIRTAMGYQFQVVGSIGDNLVANYDIDYAQLGTLVGLYLTPGIIMALPSGALSQWIGDRRTLLIALVLMIAGGLYSAYAESYSGIAAGRVLAGVGAVVLNVLLAKMVTDWFADRELAFAMAILVNSWPFGIGLGLIAQPYLAIEFGLPVTLASTALILILALVLALENNHKAQGVDESDINGPSSRLARGEIVGSLIAGAIWGCFNASLLIVLSFAPTMLSSQGMTIEAAGRLVSMVSWWGIAGVIGGGWLSSRLDCSRTILFVGFACAAVSALMMPSGELRVAAIIIFGLIGFAPAGSIMALPATVLRPQSRSIGMGIYFTVFYTAVSIFPAFAGHARDITANPAAPLWLAAGLMVVCMAFVWLFDKMPMRLP